MPSASHKACMADIFCESVKVLFRRSASAALFLVSATYNGESILAETSRIVNALHMLYARNARVYPVGKFADVKRFRENDLLISGCVPSLARDGFRQRRLFRSALVNTEAPVRLGRGQVTGLLGLVAIDQFFLTKQFGDAQAKHGQQTIGQVASQAARTLEHIMDLRLRYA